MTRIVDSKRMDTGYFELDTANVDLIELMYGIREPLGMTDTLRHPLEDIVFTYDEVMTDPARVNALAASFGLYTPPQDYKTSEYKTSDYFYLMLRSILRGEARDAYPSTLPSPGRMYQFTPKEFSSWRKEFLTSRKKQVPKELLYRLTTEELYTDRMYIFFYYNSLGQKQDPFGSSRVDQRQGTPPESFLEDGRRLYDERFRYSHSR